MIKEVRIYNGRMTATSIIVLRKLDSHMQKNQIGLLSYVILENKSKMD